MRHLLFAIAIVLGAPPAMACSIMPSELSWEEQLREQKVIFIGTVVKVDYFNAWFSVDEPILGAERGELKVARGDGGNCDHLFEVGEQWIYAGSFLGGPSREISEPYDADETAAIETVRSLVK
jgi:hypothetical protein